MKRLFLLLLVLFILPAGTVIASDTSDADYYGVIRVTNNGTDTTNVATVITGINTTSLINGGFLASNASDLSILHSGSDIAFMPGYETNPWCLFSASINADTHYNDLLYTPQVTGGKIAYFPDTAGMTTPDSLSLEFGDEFEITLSGWFDNSVNNAVFEKENAFDISCDGSGNYSAKIHPPNDVEILRPNGSGDETNITSGGIPHYQQVNDDSDGTRISEPGYIYTRDLYTLQDMSWTEDIESIILYFRLKSEADVYVAYAKPALKINGIVYEGTEQTDTTGIWTTKSQTYTNSPATGMPWSAVEINNMQYGISLHDNGGAGESSYCSDIWIVVNNSPVSVTVAESATGEHVITASANGTDLMLSVDDSSNTVSLGDASVIDNTNTIVTAADNTTFYLLYQEIKVAGVQKQYIDWEYGSTFTDQSGNGNDATPSFRTVSSDADVSAELLSFSPVSEATAPSYSVSDAQNFITDTPTITGNFSTTISPTFEGADVISDTAASSGTPAQVPFILLSGFGLLAASFTTSYFTRRANSQSIVPKLLIVLALSAILVSVQVFDFWMILYLGIMAVAFGMAKTHTTWGGEAGYNMVGFLGMSFVGMTIINRIMEGTFITSTDVGILNNVLIFRPVSVFGLFQISVPNLSFLSEGIPHLIRWDYSFFGGNAVIVQYLLYSVTGFMAFLLFVLMLGVVFNMLSRSR